MNDSTPTTCTCPSGDGSLRHPCPTHPIQRAQAQPAAAQEAVAYCHHLPGDNEAVGLFNKQTEHARIPLYAAPVAAAPVGDAFDGASYKRMFIDACEALAEVSSELDCDPEEGGAEPILAAIAKLKASTPAAPGIDLRKLSESWLEQAETMKGSSPSKAAGMWACAKELRDALDASPEGGSDARAQFEVWAAGVNLCVGRSDPDRSAYWSDRTTAAWKAWQAAMQAASAEVGS
ncbi:hypothetical protein ABB27_02590 [Stenotrophomonas terrae]|uniref:Uncharacterized protein n=1 Tax=Stenotrophomonas terrae TaxID=405446 RepID=A0A0R0CP86_9GAMM|nr:hypothetical protein [Stenotrophomonas terrae]KRG71788.1 hypothetical protein ABB27_02590 [Stenotrophomonas terrae]